MYDPDGKRNYSKDNSSDPLWKMAKILFPSNNGQLGTETTAATNLGKYVKNPKTVALLINYAKDIRDGEKFTPDEITELTGEIFKTLADEKTRPIKSFKNSTIKPLLGHIEAAIKEEIAGRSFFPEHTTEQILSAFFCYTPRQ